MQRAALIAFLSLALVGALTGIHRTVRAFAGRSAVPATRAAAVRYDSAYARLLEAASGARPGSAYQRDVRDTFARFQRKYDAHFAATLAHVVPGALFLLLAPLQLSPRIRSRRPRLHRWSGRLLLLAAAAITSSAVWFAWVAPAANWRETAIITVVASWFVLAGARAWLAIRRRDIAAHRAWMLRFLAVALGIAVVRLVSPSVWLFRGRITVETGFISALIVGWTLAAGGMEWWIRRPTIILQHGYPTGEGPEARALHQGRAIHPDHHA